MEDTSKITRKVANPAATAKKKAEVQDDGFVTVEYTKKSVNHPGRARVPKALAMILANSGKAVIIKTN